MSTDYVKAFCYSKKQLESKMIKENWLIRLWNYTGLYRNDYNQYINDHYDNRGFVCHWEDNKQLTRGLVRADGYILSSHIRPYPFDIKSDGKVVDNYLYINEENYMYNTIMYLSNMFKKYH